MLILFTLVCALDYYFIFVFQLDQMGARILSATLGRRKAERKYSDGCCLCPVQFYLPVSYFCTQYFLRNRLKNVLTLHSVGNRERSLKLTMLKRVIFFENFGEKIILGVVIESYFRKNRDPFGIFLF